MDNVIRVKDAHGITWQVRAAYAPIFLGAHTPDPRRLLRSCAGQVIKKSPARIIFASSVHSGGEELPVVIKIYRHARVGDWIKANLAGSKARREWAITNAAVERGLSTVTPVAYGERRGAGILRESYLLTVRLFDCITLEEALFSDDRAIRVDAGARREMIVLLATLLRRMHDSGIYHRDLHPGNFLVETSEAAPRRLYLLDLHRASARSSLPLATRLKSLAQFNMFASISLKKAERLLFFNSYFGEDRPWRDEKRALLEVIEKRTRAMRWRLWRGRQKRCLGTNRYFIRLRCGRLHGFASRRDWKGEMARLLLSPQALRDGATLIKESRSKALWKKEMAIQGERCQLFIKHYKPKRGLKAISYLFRPSQALRSWRGAYALAIRGLSAVTAIAALEERLPCRFLGNAYFIALTIEEVQNLSDVLGKGHPGEARETLIRGFALFLRRVHQLGVYHGDMKATNFLVRQESGGRFVFYLSDLDFIRTGLTITRRRVVRSLTQLNSSLRDLSLVTLWDRRRFLKEYCGAARRGDVRLFWARIAKATKRRLKKHVREFSHSRGA